MLPEYYTHPEKYRWYLADTDQGTKRTFAKTKKVAISKIEKKGFKVIKISERIEV